VAVPPRPLGSWGDPKAVGEGFFPGKMDE
jgi:hypothetical protein